MIILVTETESYIYTQSHLCTAIYADRNYMEKSIEVQIKETHQQFETQGVNICTQIGKLQNKLGLTGPSLITIEIKVETEVFLI